MAGAAESLEEMELCAGVAGSAEPVSDTVAGADAGTGKELNQKGTQTSKPLKAHQQERGSSYPPDPPVRFCGRKTVLAGKGSLTPRQERARPCLLRAVLPPERERRAAPAGTRTG